MRAVPDLEGSYRHTLQPVPILGQGANGCLPTGTVLRQKGTQDKLGKAS